MWDMITVLIGLLLVVATYGVYLLFRGWLLLEQEEKSFIAAIGILVLVALFVIGYINTHPAMFMAG